MRVDCIGGGALGMLLAGKLATSGQAQVRLVTRTEEQALAIRETGLQLQDPGSLILRGVTVPVVSFEEFARSSPESGNEYAILLTVKQKDIGSRLASVLQFQLGDNGLLCCFQNGIGHLEQLAEAVAPERLWSAVTTEGARRLSNSSVQHAGSGITWIGGRAQGGNQSGNDVSELIELLNKAGFDTKMSKRIDRHIWNKFVMNLVINPLTALLGVTNGALLQSQEALSLMKQLYDEAAGLAVSRQIDLHQELWEDLLAVCRATAANRSSMLQDLEAGRQTELEWLTGSLLRMAQEQGVSLPVHEVLYRLVKIKETMPG